VRPIDQAKRDELVRQTLDHLGRTGLADFSLRGLAAELGTSARMLVHYFGSKENLLSLAFAEHRRAMLSAVAAAGVAGDELPAVAERAWQGMSSAGQRPYYAVMFQLLAASLAQDHPYAEQARESIMTWVDQVAALLGGDRVRATVVASGLKGILLDFMATGDRERADAAARHLIAVTFRA
jgi:AcrR family transcriptional regulator